MQEPNKDDHYFIWNTFYYNDEDVRFLVPKRIPELGWTINFAHPAVVPFITIGLLLILLTKFL